MFSKAITVCSIMAMVSCNASVTAREIIDSLEGGLDSLGRQFFSELDPQARANFQLSGDLELTDAQLLQLHPHFEKFYNLLNRVEKRQQALRRKDDPTSNREIQRLDVLKERALLIVGEEDRFEEGATWEGTMYRVNDAIQVELTIKHAKDGTFSGELKETGRYGRPICMIVTGKQNGCDFLMQSERMKIGENRARAYEGKAFRNRIFADVVTDDPQGRHRQRGKATLELSFKSPDLAR